MTVYTLFVINNLSTSLFINPFRQTFFCTTLYVTPKNPNAHALISIIHVTTLSREITYRSLCLRNRIIVTLPSFENGRVFWQANKNWNFAMKTKHPEADFDTEELIRVHVIICHAFCGKFCIKWCYLVKKDFLPGR